MEQTRAKANNEATLASVSSVLEGDETNSLSLEKENQLLVGVRKTDISAYVETLSEEPACTSKSKTTSTVQSNLSPSTSLLSSEPIPRTKESTTETLVPVTVNENNNVDSSDTNAHPASSEEFKILQTDSTGIQEQNTLETITEQNMKDNSMSNSNINISGNDKKDNDENSDKINNCGDSNINNVEYIIKASDRGDSPEESVCATECVTLKQVNVPSSEIMESIMNDMELVNLEDEEKEDLLLKGEAQIESKINILSHSKSDSDLSTEERRAELYNDRLNPVLDEQNLKTESTVNRNKPALPTSESFNDFHYWREPMVSLDIEYPNATIGSKTQQITKTEHLAQNDEVCVIEKEITGLDLDDEIDDQIVLASLTGINTRPIVDTKKVESSSINLEDLDDSDIIKHDEKLNEVEIVDLSAPQSDGDGIELMVEPLTESAEDLNVKEISVDDDLTSALSDQLKISSQSSQVLTETENFLSNVNTEISTVEPFKTSDETWLDKGKSHNMEN